MNRYIKNTPKSNNIGCLSAILGTLAVVVCTVIYAVVSSLVSNVIVSARLGSAPACALLSLSFIAIVVSFVLYEVIFICFELARAKKNESDGASAKRMLKIVAPVCICLSLLMSVVSANTYTKLTDNSLSKVCFAEYKTYSWSDRNDVMRYTLACSSDGNLTYTLTMKDGEKFEIFGSVNSCSDSFIEEYENLYGYAAHLSERFQNSEYIIEGKVIGAEYMESFYKDARPEIWVHLETIINLTSK